MTNKIERLHKKAARLREKYLLLKSKARALERNGNKQAAKETWDLADTTLTEFRLVSNQAVRAKMKLEANLRKKSKI